MDEEGEVGQPHGVHMRPVRTIPLGTITIMEVQLETIIRLEEDARTATTQFGLTTFWFALAVSCGLSWLMAPSGLELAKLVFLGSCTIGFGGLAATSALESFRSRKRAARGFADLRESIVELPPSGLPPAMPVAHAQAD